MKEPVCKSAMHLLVIITTNEERALPDAFLRRCLVLHLSLEDGDGLVPFFVERGMEHFPNADETILKEPARQVKIDREIWQSRHLAAPGLAEYLDLVLAVTGLADTVKDQKGLLDSVKGFMLKKYSEGAV